MSLANTGIVSTRSSQSSKRLMLARKDVRRPLRMLRSTRCGIGTPWSTLTRHSQTASNER